MDHPFTATSTQTTDAEHARWIEDLAVPHRFKGAVRRLMAAGMLATPALRRGLRHDHPDVRVGCCVVLDHFLDGAAVPELIENLAHENPRVRSNALHALACERCKEGACRPGEDDVIPIAIRLLLDDESRSVRTQAAQMLTPAVHKREDVRRAMEHARDHDPDRLVRQVAGWAAPGGPIFRRLTPKPVRKTREQVQADRLAKRARVAV
ncbi:MAG TPA: HEAT repeat domain-containing protein [Chloroflexota bacterium]